MFSLFLFTSSIAGGLSMFFTQGGNYVKNSMAAVDYQLILKTQYGEKDNYIIKYIYKQTYSVNTS